MRTVNEIGISFARSNICYLGEVILKQKQQHLNGKSASRTLYCRLHFAFPREMYIAGGLRHSKSVLPEDEGFDRVKTVLRRSDPATYTFSSLRTTLVKGIPTFHHRISIQHILSLDISWVGFAIIR